MSFNSSLSGSSKPLEGLMSQQDDKTEKITIQNEATRQMEGARGGPAGNLPNEATKTPSKKMRKKKHRPKVVKEDKPAANERGKSKILETPTNKETSSSGKRKYVRKSKAQTPCGNLSNESMPKVDPAPVTGISMCVASETPNTKEITPPGKKKYVQKKKAQDHSENTSASGGIADPTPCTGILASEVSATPDNIENTASGKRKRVQKMKHVNLLGSSTSTPVVVVDSTPVRGTLKSASTKTPSIKEITPPGKRKYVRKRKAQNTLDLSSDAQIASSLENKGAYCGDATKRVRRCLSYDVEYSQSTYEQGQEYQVNDPPSSNTGSSFVKSNMQNSPGLEPGSSKEIKYDLNIQMHPATGEVRHFGAEPHQHFRTETMEANNMQDWQRQILGHSEKQASKSYSTDVATNFQCQESGGTQSDFSEVLNLLASTKQSHTGEHDALSSMHDGTMIYNEHYLPYSTRGHEKKKTEPDNNRLTYKSASPSKIMQSDAWTKNQEHHISLHTTEAFAISSLGAPKVQQSIQHMPFGQAEKVLNTLSEIPAELTSPSANRTMKQNKLSVLVKPFPDNSSQQQMSKLQNFAESKVQDNKGKGIIRKCKEEHKHHTSKDIASSSISIGCSGRKALHSSVSYNSSNLTETNSVCSYSGEPVWYSDPIDEITRRLRFLTINEASENASAQMQNAIVPYKSITEPKRKWQPRVDLDPESNKVWNLLMGKESSNNAEGTDSKKEKWWHEERRIFRGRVDSFIARMHLVQGDRRFSKWKGSVVDSVVGVFLTQNVSDHLSSSAFMALAAKFPVESRKSMNLNSEDLGVESRESCATDNKNTTKVQEHVANQHYSARTYLANMEREDSGSFKMEAGISRFGGLCANEARAVVDNCSPDSGSSTPITPRGTSGAQMENVLPPSTSSLDILGIAEGVEATSYGEIDRFSHAEVGTRSFFQDPLGLFSCKNMCSAGTGIHDARCAEPSAAPSVLNTKHLSSRQAEDYLANQTLHCANNPKKLPEASKAAVTGQCSHSQGHSSVKVQETIDTEPQIKNIQPDHLSNQQKLQKLSVKRGNIPETCKGYETSTNKDQSSYKKFSADTKGKSKKGVRGEADQKKTHEWDKLRKSVLDQSTVKERSHDRMDSVDWEAVRCADVDEIAKTIRDRGMSNVLGGRIKAFLNRVLTDHGSIDLEWLRDVEPDKTKDYLLSIEGLGLKSVECVRLLTLHHMAFPVDTNVGRICVRLGWVPLQPLPESLQLHLLEMYPIREAIQKYLWPRLCKLDQRTLYELHYQMITFGKVFCTKSKPNCNACPMRGECKHFASAFASTRLALPGLEDRNLKASTRINVPDKIGTAEENPPVLHQVKDSKETQQSTLSVSCKPIIEEPGTPEAEWIESEKREIEDAFYEDPDEIPTIELNFEEFTQNLQNFMQANKEIQGVETSMALVSISPKGASIPMPKLKNVSRLRTEHRVYEIPDSHPLLAGFEARETDDPTSYLLALWTPGETAQTTEQKHEACSFQEMGKLCASPTCFSCNSIREAEAQIVRGTILIPCRTAMRGSFPLNGTYFQVNEVFADHQTSWTPVSVPREWIWNLPRKTVYFGTSVPSIFKGLTTEETQQCFWKGFICVRGFDRETRAPKPLYARLHVPASKTPKTKDS